MTENGLPDPLSDVLRTVKLSGALFFVVDATSPWGVDIPEANVFAPIILPRARHVISYHIVAHGSGWASIPGVEPVPFRTGDIVVFPHQDPYAMQSAPGQAAELNHDNARSFFAAMAAGKLPFVVTEGGGGPERAQFICGFLGCDAQPFNPLLDALPRLMLVRQPHPGAHDLLDRLIDMTLAELPDRRIGGECVRLTLSELMFVEAIRRYLQSIPIQQTNWLSGLRDPAIGRALALLHERPGFDWTLDSLAKDAGVSRSVLAERFAGLTGHPPMRYLTLWRMQVAARLLTDSAAKVATIGEEVGYDSEAAFSRAFKKVTGASPAAWRQRFNADKW